MCVGQELWARTKMVVTGPVSYAVALQDGREGRRHVNHLRPRRADSDSTIHTDTEIAPQNSYKPFRLVILNRETEVVVSIPDASVASVTPQAQTTDVECDNVVTETRGVVVSTPTPDLPRVTTPVRTMGRSRVAPAKQANHGLSEL